MRGVRGICVWVVALAATCGLLACGGGGEREAVVIRAGAGQITNASIAHWMSVMSPQHILPIPPHYTACVANQRKIKRQATTAELHQICLLQYVATRRQALAFLITSSWLTGEAADEGVKVSGNEVKRRLAQRERSYSSKSELDQTLKAIAHTVADVELEIQAELASEKLRRKLSSEVPVVTGADITAYYRRNIRRYHIPEQRYFNIVEGLSSVRAARKMIKELHDGRSLAGTSIPESLPRKSFSDYIGEKRTIYEAIFKAPLHVLSEPIRLNNAYFLIEVTRITPAHLQSLAQVRSSIDKKLTDERHRRALAAFVAAWRKKWIARTDCSSGYVTQKCRQYTSAKMPEEPLALN